MNNSDINKAFLAMTDVTTKDEVLVAIGNRYGITKDQALEEITQPEAEHLLDYLTGGNRTAISVLMRRHRLAVN